MSSRSPRFPVVWRLRSPNVPPRLMTYNHPEYFTPFNCQRKRPCPLTAQRKALLVPKSIIPRPRPVCLAAAESPRGFSTATPNITTTTATAAAGSSAPPAAQVVAVDKPCSPRQRSRRRQRQRRHPLRPRTTLQKALRERPSHGFHIFIVIIIFSPRPGTRDRRLVVCRQRRQGPGRRRFRTRRAGLPGPSKGLSSPASVELLPRV